MRIVILLLFLILINQLFCQIEYYIETDETSYYYGQDINIIFNLHNTSNDTIIVAFANTAPFLYYIDGELFYPGSFQVVTYVTFPPDSIYTLTHPHIYDVAIGEHEVTSEFYAISNNLTADPIYFTVESVSVDNNELQQAGTQLSNYPNPFNPETTISFSIPGDSYVEISIYNIKGQKVKALTNETYDKGNHTVVWNGVDSSNKSVSSGVYFYKLSVNGKSHSMRKCLLLK